MTVRYLALAAIAVSCGGAAPAPASEPGQPDVFVCLERYNEDAGQARVRVKIDWNGYSGSADRFDIGAEDVNNDIWPQLRDERLRPQRDIRTVIITISDVTRYPLSFRLLRFTNGAAKRFDDNCRDGFCSLKQPMRDIEMVGTGNGMPSVAQAPSCKP